MNIVEDIYKKLDTLNDGPLDLTDKIIDDLPQLIPSEFLEVFRSIQQ